MDNNIQFEKQDNSIKGVAGAWTFKGSSVIIMAPTNEQLVKFAQSIGLPANSTEIFVSCLWENKGSVKKEQDLFAIGCKEEDGSFGMKDGPTPDLNQLYNTYGELGDYIFHCKKEKMIPIYRWSERKVIWMKLKSAIIAQEPVLDDIPF